MRTKYSIHEVFGVNSKGGFIKHVTSGSLAYVKRQAAKAQYYRGTILQIRDETGLVAFKRPFERLWTCAL